MSPGGDGLANVRQVARSSAPGDPTLDGSMMCGGQSGMLHLFWNNGVGSATGRFHQWSADNGVTWSKTEAIFPGLSGQTERAGCVTDSAGNLHYITAADGFGFSHAIIRHAVWRDGRWSDFENLWSFDYRAETPNLAISAGNTLHLLMTHYGEQAAQVAYTSRVVDAPHVAPPGFEAPVRVALDDDEPTAAVEIAPAQEPTPLPVGQFNQASPTRSAFSLSTVLWIGLLPSLLFLAVLIALRRRP